MSRTIGLIVGAGQLPAIFAAAVKERGDRVVVVRAIRGACAHGEIAAAVDGVHDVFLGEWSRLLGILKAEGAERVYMIGKISREYLLAGTEFDARFQQILASLKERNDDAVVEGFIRDLESEGLVVGEQTEYLSHLQRAPGVLTKRVPARHEWEDIRRGYEVAKSVAGLDVGQTVVMKEGAVTAVEAVEGTDAAISRGAKLARGGAVVIKVAKPDQDLRFDIPAVGLDTLHTMVACGASVLAFDAEQALLVEGDALVTFADEQGISLVSYRPGLEEACR